MALKNGLFYEEDALVYYRDGEPTHAGVVQVDGAIYYISSNGRAVKGEHIVHGEMTNGILKRGTYTFGEDYKLVKGSYIAPKKRKKHKIAWPAKKKTGKRAISSQIRSFLRKKENRFAIIALVAALVFLTVLVPTLDSHFQNGGSAVAEPSGTVSTDVKIILPSFEEDVLLCSKSAKLEYDGEMSLEDAVENGDPYRPFLFEYHLNNASGILYLGEKEDLSDACEYILSPKNTSVSIDNLKVDTTYFYKVVVNGQEYPGTFHTALSTRFVTIPGLVNTRDIGGYVNLDGKKVRQGLLIRGVELDGLVNAPYFIPEDQLGSVQETFGFRYDMDLRRPYVYNGEYASRLGVDHKFYSAPMYGEIFTEEYRNALKESFADLADPAKYPMYLHCTWGRDRTGTIVFLLQGVLNLSEEDMKQEYWQTGYADKSIVGSNNMDVIITGLERYEGNTLQEKIVTFLTEDIGVTTAEIASIRSIFLEG